MRSDDELTADYEALVHWADMILIATPIRWGRASSLYFKMAERLNCIQNQITTHSRVLIRNKIAGFIIVGGQDNVQGVASQMPEFFAEFGFQFPPFMSGRLDCGLLCTLTGRCLMLPEKSARK